MTSDERVIFVRDKIQEVWGISEVSEAIAKVIVIAWEDDVDEAFQRGQDAVHATAIERYV